MSKYRAVDAIRLYLAQKPDRDYCDIMNRAKHDKNFSDMIRAETIDRVVSKDGLTHKKGRFVY